jgi:hypothetical protein
LASQVLGLASPPSLAPPLLASSSLLLVSRRRGLFRAFSSEVETGSRQENASNQKLKACSDSIGTGFQGIKKAPRERGFCHALEMSVSAAASIPPHGAVRAPATGPHHDDGSCGPHHDDRGRTNHNGPAIGLATTIGTAMPTRTASARGFRRAEAGNGAQGQNCCEKVLQRFSPVLGRKATRFGT